MIFRFEDFELDADRLELRRSGALVQADALVVRLLARLVRDPDRLVTKDELVQDVWEGRSIADNAITVSVARLRKALGGGRDEAAFVTTVYGRGYRFVREVRVEHRTSQPLSSPPSALREQQPFVGRDRLLARLESAVNEARSGRGRACVLIGEPGIGKTRSVEALEQKLSGSPVRVAWGYCREGADTPPLGPWLRVLRSVVATCSLPDLERALGSSAAEVIALCESQAVKPASSSLVESGMLLGSARHHSFEAIVRAFAFAAEQSPWILVLDDLHRADAGSLELFSYLLDEIPRTRILVVATLREAQIRQLDSGSSPLTYVVGHRNCERIRIERLQEEDVKAYVAGVLDDADGRLGHAVFAKSEGNPFFMAELSKQLCDNDRDNESGLSVPDAALDLIWQRIARLDVQARGVLSAAAVIGRSFELSLLQSVTGQELSALMSSLDEALATELIIAAKDSVTAFAFGHELLRVALYDALSTSERRGWHLRVTDALEKRSIAGDTIPPSELAYHSHAALPDSDPRKTVDFCRAAAAAAAAGFAGPDVARYLKHALEALGLVENASGRLRLNLLYAATLYSRGGDSKQYTRLLTELLRLAQERGDGAMMVRAACLLNVHPGLKPLPGAAHALELALAQLEPTDTLLRSVALAMLACATPHCFDAERSHALIEQAVTLARESKTRAAMYASLSCRLYIRGGPDPRNEAAATEAEVERIAQENTARMPVLPIDLALYRALTAQQRGDAETVRRSLGEAARRSRELRHGELLWHARRLMAIDSINRGECAEGLVALEKLHTRALRWSILGTEPFRAFDRAVVFSECGAHTELVEGELRNALGYEDSEPPTIWSMKVRALATLGHGAEALASLRAVSPSALTRLPCDTHYLGTLGHVARSALLLGALEHAEAAYGLLGVYPDHYCGAGSFFSEGSVQQLLGMLAQALGRPDQARTHLRAAVAANDRAGLVLRAIEARLLLSRALVQQDREAALELARQARASAESIAVPRLAAQAAAILLEP